MNQPVVLSGDVVKDFDDSRLAEYIRKVYYSGDGPIYFVATDAEVQSRLDELVIEPASSMKERKAYRKAAPLPTGEKEGL